MRVKKHKATRRIVRYFKLHFGFREPFKVLLDGNFLHAITQLKYESNIESIISNLLGGSVKCLVSACVIKELKTLSKEDREFQPAVALARKFMRHKCECPEDTSCTDCLMRQTENGNKDHWWLATQDKDVTRHVKKNGQAGVPIIFASLNGIHLLPPSEESKTAMQEKVEVHMNVKEHELEADALAALANIETVAASKPRKQKAKAPNPLAARPSKARQHPIRHQMAEKGVKKKIRRPVKKRTEAAES